MMSNIQLAVICDRRLNTLPLIQLNDAVVIETGTLQNRVPKLDRCLKFCIFDGVFLAWQGLKGNWLYRLGG